MYKCGQCGNEQDFYLVWDHVTVKKEARPDGSAYGPTEVDPFLAEEDAQIECAICGVQHLVEEVEE